MSARSCVEDLLIDAIDALRLLLLVDGLTRAFLDARSVVIVVIVNNLIIDGSPAFVIIVTVNNVINIIDGTPVVIIVHTVVVTTFVMIIVIIVIATDPAISPASWQRSHGICDQIAAY